MDAETRFDALTRRLVAEHEDAAAGVAFHKPGVKIQDKIAAMLVDGALVLKLPAARSRGLVEDRRAAPFVIGTRTMREWVVVPEADGGWDALADEAVAFVRTTAAPR